MNVLGKILKLLADIPEQDLGTIYDLLERLVAQNKKGFNHFLMELKAFLRREGFDSLIVNGQSDPVNSSGRLLYHERCPDFEFDEGLFKLVSIGSFNPKPKNLWDVHNQLLTRGLKCVNMNLLGFLAFRAGIFPESWKKKKILLMGTILKEHDPNKSEADLLPMAMYIWFDLETPFPSQVTRGYSSSHKYMVDTRVVREDFFILCFK